MSRRKEKRIHQTRKRLESDQDRLQRRKNFAVESLIGSILALCCFLWDLIKGEVTLVYVSGMATINKDDNWYFYWFFMILYLALSYGLLRLYLKDLRLIKQRSNK